MHLLSTPIQVRHPAFWAAGPPVRLHSRVGKQVVLVARSPPEAHTVEDKAAGPAEADKLEAEEAEAGTTGVVAEADKLVTGLAVGVLCSPVAAGKVGWRHLLAWAAVGQGTVNTQYSAAGQEPAGAGCMLYPGCLSAWLFARLRDPGQSRRVVWAVQAALAVGAAGRVVLRPSALRVHC